MLLQLLKIRFIRTEDIGILESFKMWTCWTFGEQFWLNKKETKEIHFRFDDREPNDKLMCYAWLNVWVQVTESIIHKLAAAKSYTYRALCSWGSAI